VQKGEREGSITLIVAKAVEKKIPVVEVDRRRLDMMSGGGVHQG
jgi:23S rRNA (guanosine2251-2'-O)-methyltransferase